MQTTTDLRTPTQRGEDSRDEKRRPLERLLDWLIDAPGDLVGADDRAGIVSRYLDHKVEAVQVRSAIAALKVRNAYLPAVDDSDQADLDAALDVLLDLVECDDCHQLHPSDEVRECDHGTFGVEGYPSCFTAFHAGRRCPSVDD